MNLIEHANKLNGKTWAQKPLRSGSGWTEERTERLKRYWADGYSASYIADALGGTTRNAVLGKTWRLKLAQRAIGGRLSRAQKKAMYPKRKRILTPRAARQVIERAAQKSERRLLLESLAREPLPPPHVSDVARVSWADLEETIVPRQHCRWPVGEPTQGYCGCTPVPGLPYCPDHARRAYRAPNVAMPHVPNEFPRRVKALSPKLALRIVA